jgi:hypothetical protein
MIPEATSSHKREDRQSGFCGAYRLELIATMLPFDS